MSRGGRGACVPCLATLRLTLCCRSVPSGWARSSGHPRRIERRRLQPRCRRLGRFARDRRAPPRRRSRDARAGAHVTRAGRARTSDALAARPSEGVRRAPRASKGALRSHVRLARRGAPRLSGVLLPCITFCSCLQRVNRSLSTGGAAPAATVDIDAGATPVPAPEFDAAATPVVTAGAEVGAGIVGAYVSSRRKLFTCAIPTFESHRRPRHLRLRDLRAQFARAAPHKLLQRASGGW